MPQVNVSRDERIARQRRDPGDPDDEVHRKDAARSLVYHDREDCYILQQSTNGTRSETRGAAQRNWRAPCLHCVLEEH